MFILTCLNSSHLQKVLHLMKPLNMFSPLLKIVFELVNFYALSVLLLFFVSPLPHPQNFPFTDVLHPGRKSNKKSCSGQDWVNREGGAW